jgi:outer membrane lipoprotein SlyB
MKNRILSLAFLGTAIISAAGCVEQPPRVRYDDGGYDRHRVCGRCGVIDDVGRTYIRQNGTSGGGAVLGAIIGGVLGSTIGKGDGRTAATVAGAVGGGFAGNAIERNGNDGDRDAWQFHVRMDNGQYATVVQYENDGLRPGDRVMIRDQHLVRLPR